MAVDLPRSTTNFFVFVAFGLIVAVVWFSLPDCSDTEMTQRETPEAWDRVAPGMSQQDVKQELGPPVLSYEDLDTPPDLTVEYWEYSERRGSEQKRLIIRFENGVVADSNTQ